MLTQNLYTVFTEAVKSQQRLFVAVGTGQHDADRSLAQLADEVERKAAEAVAYLDDAGQVVPAPTPRLQVAVTFAEGEAVGTLRECGLFGGAATQARGSGALLAYYTHEAVEKKTDTPLTRRIVIDLAPAGVTALGRTETHLLGNTRTRELHDLDNQTPRCQIDEIARDRRYYFDSVEASEALGYDLCAYCFGRERSKR